MSAVLAVCNSEYSTRAGEMPRKQLVPLLLSLCLWARADPAEAGGESPAPPVHCGYGHKASWCCDSNRHSARDHQPVQVSREW